MSVGRYGRLPQALGGARPNEPAPARDFGTAVGGLAATAPRCRALARRTAIVCAGVLGFATVWFGCTHREHLLQLRRAFAFAGKEERSSGDVWGCGLFNDDVDYKLPIVAAVPNTASETECVRRCVENAECMAWTFGKQPGISGFSNVCFLKALKQEDLPPPMGPRVGVVSGSLPCHMEGRGTLASLFCFTMARESTHDTRLLQLQHRERVGCFACDALALYSNKTFEVAPGVWTIAVEGGFQSRGGGEAGAALSLEVAMRIWQDIARRRLYLEHDWTVKAAIDALFIPQRLRGLLPHHAQANQGVYLNNCRFNLRGAIEVLSRTATDAWVQGVGTCFQHSAEKCSGPCGWGEDVFLDQCLGQVLRVKRDNEWRLLRQDQCRSTSDTGPWTPEVCSSDHVAFHPFRTPELMSQCLAVARAQLW